MLTVTPLEVTFWFLLIGFGACFGALIVALLFIYGGTHLLRRLGLTVYLGYADRPVKAPETTAAPEPNKAVEPMPEDEPEPEQEPQRNPDDYDGPPIAYGPCRGCRLPHVGLCPARVEMHINGFKIVPGTPFVCPRCWVGMNPDDRTNIARGGHEEPNERRPDNRAGMRPVFSGREQVAAEPQTIVTVSNADEVAELEKETAPDITCAKCGCKGRDNPQMTFKAVRPPGGAPTGKFWCQACVDALGGPGDKPKKKPKR